MGQQDLVLQLDSDPARSGREPFGKRRPSRVLERALAAPPVTRPELLADYWHLLLTGAHHDPVHGLAVALDARGGALADPPGLLAETLSAAARRVPPESRWRIPRTPPSAGVPESALRALAAIPGELDFVRGWALAVLGELLAGAGLRAEGHRLAEGLSNRFDARRHALRLFASPADRYRSTARDDTVRRWRLPFDSPTGRGELPFFVGRPAPGFHPLHFQAAWAAERYGGRIPRVVMDRLRDARHRR